MKKVDIIFFDLDGTLIDARRAIVHAVNATLKELRLKEKSFREIVSYIGTGVGDLIRQAVGVTNEKHVAHGVDLFERSFRTLSCSEARLYPHVHEVLEHFKSKNIFIVTNRTEAMARLSLRAFDIERYCKKIIGGDDEHCLKPSACPINKALAYFIDNKRQAIMVGDMDLDIFAGKEAGILTCAVTYGIGTRKDIESAHPDFIIDDIAELKRIVH